MLTVVISTQAPGEFEVDGTHDHATAIAGIMTSFVEGIVTSCRGGVGIHGGRSRHSWEGILVVIEGRGPSREADRGVGSRPEAKARRTGAGGLFPLASRMLWMAPRVAWSPILLSVARGAHARGCMRGWRGERMRLTLGRRAARPPAQARVLRRCRGVGGAPLHAHERSSWVQPWRISSSASASVI